MHPDHSTLDNATLVDRYRIERELGRGGMATVYAADDLKHGRKVAIKVLRRDLGVSIGADRFLREIETAARLSHPHIVPLHDSGVIDDLFFYVMPLVQGESLRQRLEREGRLPIHEAIGIARQVASALDYAHRAGVIHRDIKPENILLHEGEAMVTDFGIALARERLTGARLTDSGMIVGTPEYMSPEQSLGEPVLDARSDVYSVGCVLFEMLTGESPHRAPTAQGIIAKRLTSPVPLVRRLRADVPSRVERVVQKTLAVDPAERFLTAAALADALVEDTAAAPVRIPTVAVLPFRNVSADPENEYFADGITEDVIAQLSKIRALRVISRTSVMQFRSHDQSLREIGGALEATTILEGSVRRAGERVRIVAQLVDVDTDQHLWAETYDRQLIDIFAIQTDVALHIARALRAELTGDEQGRLRKEPTADLEAYQLYLQGRACYVRFTPDGMQRSLEYFERAIARDPTYAIPHVGLALACNELAEGGFVPPDEAYPRSKASALRALEIDPELGEAHCVLAVVKFIYEYDWVGAEAEFRQSLELTPGNADAYDLYGRMCSSLGRFDEAIALTKRAFELDPMVHRADLATAYLRAGRYDEAQESINRALEVDPHYARARATLGWIFAKQGRFDEALRELRSAVSLAPTTSLWQAQLGQVQAMAGQVDESRSILAQLHELATTKYVSPYHFAYVHTGLGEPDRAMDYLEQAYEARSGAVYGIKGSFLFTDLHGHPRFIALLRRMNVA